jgi:LmbE family N-acetylglucosaminyl deacetylase
MSHPLSWLRSSVAWSLALAVAAASPSQSAEPQAGLIALHQACLDAKTGGVVLNVAAHPDDEASRTNAILRRKYGLRVVTAYTTFGDGGQNAVGREIGPGLARLRVRETLRAAALSDVEVRWLGMNDFGFSKTLDETLAVWGADVLKDAMRRVVDEVEPDIVITNHDLVHGHGHHRATFWAITEVLKERAAKGGRVPPLYSRCSADEAQLTFDPGELDAARGETYARMAHRAWTQHVTQGPWGPHNPLQVGVEHWQLVMPAGATAQAAADWQHWVRKDATLPANEIAGLAQEQLVERARTKLRSMRDPAGAVAQDGSLGGAPVVARLPGDSAMSAGGFVDAQHVAVLQRILLAAADVSIETWLEHEEVARGGEGKVFVVVHGFDRLKDVKVACRGVAAEQVKPTVRPPTTDVAAPPARVPGAPPPAKPKPPEPPKPVPGELVVAFAHQASGDTTPEEGPRPAWVTLDVSFTLDGVPIELHPRLWYTPVDPVEVEWDRDVVMVPKGQTVERIVSATVRSHRDTEFSEPVRLSTGNGVKAEAIPGRVSLSREHPEARLLVRATVAADELPADAALRLEVAGQQAALRLAPVEVLVPPGLKVGLVRGPDDATERALADLGIAYTALDRDALATAKLEEFTTLLLDIRAYNHRPELAENKDRILQFCRSGGRVVAMYHKPGEWNERAGHPLLAPFPLTVGELRATEEQAPVAMLQPEHRLWHYPHAITQRDFDGWVQERGLHFPTKWDPAWTPLLELKDGSDEKPSQGALLHTQYGRGDFVYCSLVLYRQLRQGHQGAARILVNLLAR